MARVQQQRRRTTRRAVRREKKSVPHGKVFIHATFNNTIVSITDPQGNVVSWASGGTAGFKGSRKSTPYAAQLASQAAGRAAAGDYNMREVDVFVKGPGPGRENAVRALVPAGLTVTSITDVTFIFHNGVRPFKKCCV